jgi:hypothetical protein
VHTLDQGPPPQTVCLVGPVRGAPCDAQRCSRLRNGHTGAEAAVTLDRGTEQPSGCRYAQERASRLATCLQSACRTSAARGGPSAAPVGCDKYHAAAVCQRRAAPAAARARLRAPAPPPGPQRPRPRPPRARPPPPRPRQPSRRQRRPPARARRARRRRAPPAAATARNRRCGGTPCRAARRQ